MDDGLVEMVVESVRVHMPSSRHVVILKDTRRERYLPIWIGPWEASAIAMRLQGLTPERPLTHDLFARALGELGVRIDQVVISALADETFHARLVLTQNGRTLELDSRPSDALALAVRAGVRIYAAERVLDVAGLGPEGATVDDEVAFDGGEEGEIGPEGRRSRRRGHPELTGERVADERLELFRDFVNSLEIDASGEGPSGTS